MAMNYKCMNPFEFTLPTKIIFGPGCVKQLAEEIAAIGGKKPLIITDPGIRKAGIDRIVEENRVGTVIGYRADEFYRAVRHYAASPEECEEIRHRARALYEANYRWQAMRERLVDAYRTL